MSIIRWNLRSFHSQQEQVKVLFHDYNASVICLQETKLGETNVNVGFNYVLYRSPPFVGVRTQGGTAIIVRRSLNHKAVEINSVLQACAVQVFLDKWITLCSLYLEPELDDHLLDRSGNPRRLELCDLQNLIDQLPRPFILMGDFNAKNTLWGELQCDPWGLLIE